MRPRPGPALTNPVGPYQPGRGCRREAQRAPARDGAAAGVLAPCQGSADGTLGYLRGRWLVERGLTDHLSGRSGTFTGEAAFRDAGIRPAVSDPDGETQPGRAPAGGACPAAALHYSERGDLRFGDHSGPASRSLLYVREPGGLVAVRYADGRSFHDLDLSRGSWHAVHRCREDRYQVSYHLLGTDSYLEHWAAAGPRKSYEIVTTMRRIRS